MNIPAFGLPALDGQLPADHDRQFIMPGSLGTAQTISAMRKMVKVYTPEVVAALRSRVTTGKRDMRVRQIIGNIIENCPSKDHGCYAEALYVFARDKVRYAFDPVGVEYVEDPIRIATESRIADCDSIAAMLATFYEAIGLPSRFVTIKADPERPNEYSHVYLQVRIPRRGWVAADPTQPDKYFGWEPPQHFPRTYWPASNDAESEMEARDDQLETAMRGLGEGYIPGIMRAPTGKFPGGAYLRANFLSGLGAERPGYQDGQYVDNVVPIDDPFSGYGDLMPLVEGTANGPDTVPPQTLPPTILVESPSTGGVRKMLVVGLIGLALYFALKGRR
jgi:hypothetical protein